MSVSDGLIVVLPHHIEVIPYSSNLLWLTLFYALPRELVEKRPAYLSLPRNINSLNDRDQQILKLQMQGKTMEEIAPQVGYSAAGSVHKRLQQIAEAYRKRKS